MAGKRGRVELRGKVFELRLQTADEHGKDKPHCEGCVAQRDRALCEALPMTCLDKGDYVWRMR